MTNDKSEPKSMIHVIEKYYIVCLNLQRILNLEYKGNVNYKPAMKIVLQTELTILAQLDALNNNSNSNDNININNNSNNNNNNKNKVILESSKYCRQAILEYYCETFSQILTFYSEGINIYCPFV